MITYIRLRDFTDTLGAEDGPSSATDYFQQVFKDILKNSILYNNLIYIDATGTYGVPHTFMRKLIELSIKEFGLNDVMRTIDKIYGDNIEETRRLMDILHYTTQYYKY